jgi:hypothetical protein
MNWFILAATAALAIGWAAPSSAQTMAEADLPLPQQMRLFAQWADTVGIADQIVRCGLRDLDWYRAFTDRETALIHNIARKAAPDDKIGQMDWMAILLNMSVKLEYTTPVMHPPCNFNQSSLSSMDYLKVHE